MPLNIPAIPSAFHTFALAQCGTPGFNALSSRAVCCTDSRASDLRELSLARFGLGSRGTTGVPKGRSPARACGAARLPPPLPREAQALLIFPRSHKATRRVGILGSDTTAQLCFALLYSCTDSRRLIPPARAFHSMAAIHLGSSPPPAGLRYGGISAVPGEASTQCPAAAAGRYGQAFFPPGSADAEAALRSARVCGGSAPGKAGPALASHFSYSFASLSPFRAH